MAKKRVVVKAPGYHTQEHYIDLVLRACYLNGGEATFDQQREYIKRHLKLNREDEETYISNQERWKQIHRNLKSNRVLESRGLARSVKDGFALTRAGVLHVERG